jgi:hypothetical protein
MSVVARRRLHGITDEFVARLAERADEAEQLRRLPAATVTEFKWAGALAIGAKISPIAMI